MEKTSEIKNNCLYTNMIKELQQQYSALFESKMAEVILSKTHHELDSVRQVSLHISQ